MKDVFIFHEIILHSGDSGVIKSLIATKILLSLAYINTPKVKSDLKIVYLEGSEAGAVTARQALNKAGINAEIRVACNNHQYIAALAGFAPDIILSEYTLAAIHCSEAVASLRQSGLKIPFIIVSNAVSDEMAEELLMLGVDDYIIKDQPGRLPFAIQQSLEKYKLKKEQQDMLEQLTNSEKRFRTLVENSMEAVVVLNAQAQPTYVSPAVKNVLGYSPQEVLNMDLFTLPHPDDAEEHAKVLMKVLASPGVPIQGHTGRMLHKDGTWRWIEATVTNLLHEPAINGIVDNFRDVTDTVLADRQLKHKEGRLSQAQAVAHLGSWELDLATQTNTFSDEACRICGLSLTDNTQSAASWISFIHPDDVEYVLKRNRDAIDSQQAADYYFRIVRKDGQVRYLHAQTHVELNSQGQPVSLYGVMHDVTQIRKSEQALRSSESNLRAIFENSMEGFILADTKAVIKYFNNKASNFYKLSTGKKIQVGGSLFDAVSEDKSADYQMMITSVLSGKTRQYDHIYELIDGESKWLSIMFVPVYENGEITGLSLSMSDITDRKLAQELLERSESNLNAIINNTDSLIYSLDTDLRYITYNQALKSMMKERYGIDVQPGNDIRESLGKFDPGSAHEWEVINARTLSGEILKFEKLFLYNGSNSYLSFSIHPIIKDNTVTGLSCFVNDVTREKHAEQEVLKALEEKNVILESIGDGFYTLDKNWIVTYWNKQAETMLNCPKDTILGRVVWDVFSDIVGTEFHHNYHKAIEQNAIQHFESYYERDKAWFEVTAYPSPNGLSVYFRDVTERKHSEFELDELHKNLQKYTDELLASNKGLEQFSYILSHNLRAPVANIIGLAELVNQDTYPAQVKQQFVTEILVNVKRLDDVISDLNRILQVKRGVSENREPVSLQQLIDQISSSIQNIIEKEHVRIETNFSAVNELFTLKSYLHSIFFNLIMNSIKYRQKDVDPVIRIISSREQDIVTLSFQDNGMGIDLASKGAQLFGLYKRFHHHVEGKGMGLFMVKTQVEMLGGKIAVESVVNQGTEVRVAFRPHAYQIPIS
ncbi:PAS domain S-box-containing protein [Dyadobacter psychrophilus]|uniref:histidine kinase n=1 Tax=Dyadobacter psychrophilus TaxID=651661 RepID=A0A1T5B5L7_9BACT|nr:PAS domain S-box-containing protein [Dyadobacter psychrophilus]